MSEQADLGYPRVQELLRFMKTRDPKRVYLETWRQNPKMIKRVTDEELASDCGTVACVAGWACAHKPFQEQGLAFVAGEPFCGGRRAFRALNLFFFGIDTTYVELLEHAGLFEERWEIDPALSDYDIAIRRIETFLDSVKDKQ